MAKLAQVGCLRHDGLTAAVSMQQGSWASSFKHAETASCIWKEKHPGKLGSENRRHGVVSLKCLAHASSAYLRVLALGAFGCKIAYQLLVQCSPNFGRRHLEAVYKYASLVCRTM